MINLKNKDTGQFIGTITEEQLKFLFSEFEEESLHDTDYWINRTEIEMLREDGGDPDLVNILLTALGNADDMEIVWERI